MVEKIVPIIKEDHGSDYTGLPFLTLVNYQHQPYVVIVDNYINKTLSCYVLDFCEAALINIDPILKCATDWWEDKCIEPLSVYLSRAGLSEITTGLYKTFLEEHIIRVIGPIPVYEMNQTYGTKRRKYRDVKSIEIKKASY